MQNTNRRRWTSRCHKQFEVAIRCRGRDGVETLIRGNTQDLGFGGMFVRTQSVVTSLREYTDVDVMLIDSQLGDMGQDFFRANVTRISEDGIGLRIIHDGPDSCRTLQAALN